MGNGIRFEQDSYRIDEESAARVGRMVDLLKEKPGYATSNFFLTILRNARRLTALSQAVLNQRRMLGEISKGEN